MRDEDQRAAPVTQQVLQPLDGVDVEVVGGFVQQQQIGLGDQRLRQRDALPGAAGQRFDRRAAVQLQALQRLGDALLPGPAAQRLQARLHGVEVVCRVVALEAFAQRARLGHAFGHRLEHGHAGANTGSCAT